MRLRIAQADDALADIRHHLRVIAGLWQFKKLNTSGTGNQPNTRMRTLYARFKHRIRLSVLCYRVARSALMEADPSGSWVERLKELKEADVRGPGKDDFTLQESNRPDSETSTGRYEISWIWLVPRPSKESGEEDSGKQVLDEGMRIEWSKSQARKDRWEEEVHLIQEEMRRTIAYYEWKQLWWLEQENQHSGNGNSIQSGIRAYAQKQAYYCRCMAEGFASTWLPFLKLKGITPAWHDKYVYFITNKESTKVSTDGDDVHDDEVEEEEAEREKQVIEVHDAFELDD